MRFRPGIQELGTRGTEPLHVQTGFARGFSGASGTRNKESDQRRGDGKHAKNRGQEDLDVEPEAPVIEVMEIEMELAAGPMSRSVSGACRTWARPVRPGRASSRRR